MEKIIIFHFTFNSVLLCIRRARHNPHGCDTIMVLLSIHLASERYRLCVIIVCIRVRGCVCVWVCVCGWVCVYVSECLPQELNCERTQMEQKADGLCTMLVIVIYLNTCFCCVHFGIVFLPKENVIYVDSIILWSHKIFA